MNFSFIFKRREIKTLKVYWNYNTENSLKHKDLVFNIQSANTTTHTSWRWVTGTLHTKGDRGLILHHYGWKTTCAHTSWRRVRCTLHTAWLGLGNWLSTSSHTSRAWVRCTLHTIDSRCLRFGGESSGTITLFPAWRWRSQGTRVAVWANNEIHQRLRTWWLWTGAHAAGRWVRRASHTHWRDIFGV